MKSTQGSVSGAGSKMLSSMSVTKNAKEKRDGKKAQNPQAKDKGNKDKIPPKKQPTTTLKDKGTKEKDAKDKDVKGVGPKTIALQDVELEAFQNLLNESVIKAWSRGFRASKNLKEGCVPDTTFKQVMKSPELGVFPLSSMKPDTVERIVSVLAVRFRPQKFDESGNPDDNHDVDIMEALLALSLLARVSYDEKINLIFTVCDTDNDQCLSLKEISNLCLIIEKAFSRETYLVTFTSTILLYALADKKAKMKFDHFVMCYNKEFEDVELTDDLLISIEEFITSLKGSKELYQSFLPPSLDLKKVLEALKTEEEYNYEGAGADNFIYFRYEMNWLFRRKDFIKPKKEGKSLPQLGEMMIKLDSGSKPAPEKYRPPGKVKGVKSDIKAESLKYIENCIPTDGFFVKKEEKSKGPVTVTYEKETLDKIEIDSTYLPSEFDKKKHQGSKEVFNDQAQSFKNKEYAEDAERKLEDEKKTTFELLKLIKAKTTTAQTSGFKFTKGEKPQVKVPQPRKVK